MVVSSWGHECPHMPGVRAGAGCTAGGGAGPVFRVFVIPSALVRSRWANHLNVACNSPEVRARPGFTSLELQRFWVCLNVQSIELHATLLRSCPEAARLATIAEHIAPTPMALVSAPELPASQNISPITPMPAIIRRGSLHCGRHTHAKARHTHAARRTACAGHHTPRICRGGPPHPCHGPPHPRRRPSRGGNCTIRATTRRRHADRMLLMVQNPHPAPTHRAARRAHLPASVAGPASASTSGYKPQATQVARYPLAPPP